MRPPVDPETEVIGQAMLSIVENLQQESIKPFLVRHNLTHIEPETWYPAERFVNLLREISDASGGMGNLTAIGMAISTKLLMPPDLENAPLSVILSLWNDLYHMQHRNGNIGEVQVEKITETHYRTIHTHLYPDDVTWGLAYGMAKRFLPYGTEFTVLYEPPAPRLDYGDGDRTIIDVKWE